MEVLDLFSILTWPKPTTFYKDSTSSFSRIKYYTFTGIPSWGGCPFPSQRAVVGWLAIERLDSMLFRACVEDEDEELTELCSDASSSSSRASPRFRSLLSCSCLCGLSTLRRRRKPIRSRKPFFLYFRSDMPLYFYRTIYCPRTLGSSYHPTDVVGDSGQCECHSMVRVVHLKSCFL